MNHFPDADASLGQVIAWLVWNDPNGCYTDEDCATEGLEPLTLETAQAIVERIRAEEVAA